MDLVTGSVILSVITNISLGPYSTDEMLSRLLTAVIFMANLAGGIVVGAATVRGPLIYLFSLVRRRGEDIPKEGILQRELQAAENATARADLPSPQP